MRRKMIFFNPPVIAAGGSPPSPGGLIQVVQINHGDGTWNTPAETGWFRWCANESSPATSITNSGGTNTGWSMTRPTIAGYSEGTTSTTAGYPDNVTKYGNAGTGDAASWVLSGLDNDNTYDFDFFGSTVRSWENAAGTTEWDIGGTSVTITHKNYTGDKVSITDISPTSGSITIDLTKAGSASNWYYASTVIKEYG